MVKALLLCFVFCCVHSELLIQPEQIHLSYGTTHNEMVVTWVTMNMTEPSQVQYGRDASLGLTATARANATLFTDGGNEHRSMWIHRVVLTDLKPAVLYLYHVGSAHGWSELFYFKSVQAGSAWSPVIAVFGDMGNAGAISMASLQQAAQRHLIDSVLHIGDFGYDLDTDNARVGDAFMNQIEPIAAYVPYMVCPGNHEEKYNFSNYKHRFPMPDTHGGGLFYSYNIGPAHIVSISTELYYYDAYNITGGLELIAKQYDWLKNDLINANMKRSEQPWIIVVGHRPMYCSNQVDVQHCRNLHNNRVRTGTPDTHAYGLEDLFYNAGVDLQFYAHQHSYERLWPVYNLTVCNGSTTAYVDPRAPVHMVTGSAGNHEGQTGFGNLTYSWSSFHTDDFGYTKMHILNATHINLEQLSINQGGKVVDKIILIKNRHGPGLYDCHT